MGVPRLFRLLAERFPLILRDCDAAMNPEFDNLYLDFNGVRDALSLSLSLSRCV
jgi:5'-3' exoribonuclease 1